MRYWVWDEINSIIIIFFAILYIKYINYLKTATGNAWASQVKAIVEFWGEWIVKVDVKVEKEGALKPTGSKIISILISFIC